MLVWGGKTATFCMRLVAVVAHLMIRGSAIGDHVFALGGRKEMTENAFADSATMKADHQLDIETRKNPSTFQDIR